MAIDNSAQPPYRTRLIIQADDYGACAPITDGILDCFAAGVVTQASVMVPPPDSGRAIWLARQAGLPLGVHLVLACEWDFLRWFPLTPAPSLRAKDGAFLPGVDALGQHATLEDAYHEMCAQIAAAYTAGVEPTHMESHVGVFDADVLAKVSSEWRLPCRDPVPAPGHTMALDSLWHLSPQPYETKVDQLVTHVRSLEPGTHMIVVHPARDHPELSRLCPTTSRRWKWARDIRITDHEALLDRRFVQTCVEFGVDLVALEPPIASADSPKGLRL